MDTGGFGTRLSSCPDGHSHSSIISRDGAHECAPFGQYYLAIATARSAAQWRAVTRVCGFPGPFTVAQCSARDGRAAKKLSLPFFSCAGSYRARGARGALYSFLFIGLPGPGGFVFWFFVVTLRPDPPAQQVRPVRGTSRAHRCAGPQGAREPSVLGEAARRRSRAEETERAGCGASRWDGGSRLHGIPRRWRARPGVGEF